MNQGDKVKVHYTGTLIDGTIFDTSEGKNPLEFTIGENQVIPEFENGVKNMQLNEEKTINIKVENAYGQRNEKLIVRVPRERFPPEIEVGGLLVLKGPEGQQVPAVVQEVKDDAVLIDLNHPLAGKELTFKVKVVAIN